MDDPRDDRITELEAELAAAVATIAKQQKRNAEQAEQIAALTKQVEELLRKLGQNSSNSHLPPSSDPPGTRQQRRAKAKAKRKERRKRGGQQGHRGSHRELLPAEQVDHVVDLFPPQCANCWKDLPQDEDPSAKRYQQTELPVIRPETTEWRRHAVVCPCCGHKTRAAYDAHQIPASPFGPHLMALMALLTGIYHLSRRKARDLLRDVLGVQVSLGALSAVEGRVSDAVRPAVDEAWERVGRARVKHTDGTSWYQAGVLLSLWTLATKAATVFKIVVDGSKDTLRPLYGTLSGILVSDRAKVFSFWVMKRRQVCWAHLIRRFVSFSERDGPASAFGRELLDYAGVVFEYWHDYQAGKLSREQLGAWMAPVREQVEATLARAVAADIKGLSGSCADMLAHQEALWTFVDQRGVPPTNNHAEQELRAFVLWRKRSFGTQSQRGNRFAERLMSVSATARKQNQDVLAYLTACCEAAADERSAPSLFEAETA